MKAWKVRDPNEWCATIVFAETAGKARALAMHTETCEDLSFTDIQVLREKAADKYYTPGKLEMDWYNAADRVAMVKDLGFSCDPYELTDHVFCDQCPAKEWCGEYQDHVSGEVPL
nr:MAG TPA: hypothetical protein [Caudoviricetes sp.]